MNSRMFLLFLFEVKVYENVKKLKIGMLALLARFASVILRKKHTNFYLTPVFILGVKVIRQKISSTNPKVFG